MRKQQRIHQCNMNKAFATMTTLFAMFQNFERFFFLFVHRPESENKRERESETCRRGHCADAANHLFYYDNVIVCGKASIPKHFRRSPIWCVFFFLVVLIRGNVTSLSTCYSLTVKQRVLGVINLSAETRNFRDQRWPGPHLQLSAAEKINT